MKAGILFVLLCIVFVFIGPDNGYAKTVDNNVRQQTLNDLSDRIFQYADANQVDAAKNLLNEFDRVWSSSEADYSETDGRVVDTAVSQLKLLLDSGVNSSEIRNAAISLRLCIDALTTSGSPLWKGLQSQVTLPINGMIKALENKDQTVFQEELNRFLDSYALIYPSLMIDGNPDAVQMANNSVSAFADQRMSTVQDRTRINQINLIGRELTGVFDQSPSSNRNGLSPLMLTVGGLLLLVLFYVSMRKYIGDRFKRRKGIR